MPTAYWGIAEAVGVRVPDSWQEWLLLFTYAVLFTSLLFRDRVNLQAFSWRQWLGWLGLGLSALVAGQFLPITWRVEFSPLLPGSGEPITLFLLAAIPALLAGLVLGPGPALLVGMSMGLGRSLAQSHQPIDLFHYAFAAWIAASLMHLNYRGRFYGFMRLPPVSGGLGFGAIAIMAGLAVLLAGPNAALFGRLEMALAVAQAQALPLLLEGIAGGLIVALVALARPSWRSGKDLAPSPSRLSVRAYLVSNLLFFIFATTIVVAYATFALSTYLSTRLVVAEMAAGAVAASTELAELQTDMENSLSSYSEEDEASEGDKQTDSALGRVFRQGRHYEQVLLVDSQNRVAGAYPASGQAVVLNSEEQQAVDAALEQAERSLVVAQESSDTSRVSLVVPLAVAEASAPVVFVGRLNQDVLQDILDNVRTTRPEISGAIVDGQGTVITRIGSGAQLGTGNESGRGELVATAPGGTARLSQADDGTRQLVFKSLPGAAHLRVMAAVPYVIVLQQGLKAAASVVLLLLVMAGVFYARLSNYSRDLSETITDITQSTRALLTQGATTTPQPIISRPDELGELSSAFYEMQKGFRRRLEEQSLLLSVTREASASIDLAESLPAMLNGVLRISGAAGARALVLNPAGGRLLAYAAGPSGDKMAPLDGPLLAKLRKQETIVLTTRATVAAELAGTDLQPTGIQSLYAFQMHSNGRFLGFLVAGFRQPGEIGEKERETLKTLADQASVLLQRSYLFTHAESSRRRLAAVFASTSEAVIVIDQTSRVLIVNNAMERAFNIRAQDAVNRVVSDVIDAAPLIDALTGDEIDTHHIEVTAKDGSTYSASISAILNQEGQVLGRVAVLHDITHQKEVDRLKSEFVDNVSHDLRTPLTILSGYASGLALMDDLTDEQRAYTDKILQSVEQMIGLVENLLDLGRIEAGVDLDFELLDVAVLLQEMADEHWLFAHESGIKLNVRVAEGLPRLRADRNLLRQAVANLLTNGFKYAPHSGSMTLSAELSDTGREMIISIRDRGPGIASVDQRRLFEKFFRVKRHGGDGTKGSGLGLAMVKSIAERHGGRAWCHSEPGKGSTFYFSVPLTESDVRSD